MESIPNFGNQAMGLRSALRLLKIMSLLFSPVDAGLIIDEMTYDLIDEMTYDLV